MLNSGKLNSFLHNSLWVEAANTATLLENNLLTLSRTLSPFQQCFGKGKRSILLPMQKISEMCVATYRDNTHQAKLANHATLGICVSYADDHLTSTYWVLKPKTKRLF